MAESKETVEVQVRVFRCSKCAGYLIAVGSLERTIGSLVPVSCLFVTGDMYSCSGQYGLVPTTDAAAFLAELSNATMRLETDRSEG